ncbi:hypothetical protein BC938DRAFT_471813, partial [Jimgerdemannia flammicorona]
LHGITIYRTALPHIAWHYHLSHRISRITTDHIHTHNQFHIAEYRELHHYIQQSEHIVTFTRIQHSTHYHHFILASLTPTVPSLYIVSSPYIVHLVVVHRLIAVHRSSRRRPSHIPSFGLILSLFIAAGRCSSCYRFTFRHSVLSSHYRLTTNICSVSHPLLPSIIHHRLSVDHSPSSVPGSSFAAGRSLLPVIVLLLSVLPLPFRHRVVSSFRRLIISRRLFTIDFVVVSTSSLRRCQSRRSLKRKQEHNLASKQKQRERKAQDNSEHCVCWWFVVVGWLDVGWLVELVVSWWFYLSIIYTEEMFSTE